MKERIAVRFVKPIRVLQKSGNIKIEMIECLAWLAKKAKARFVVTSDSYWFEIEGKGSSKSVEQKTKAILNQLQRYNWGNNEGPYTGYETWFVAQIEVAGLTETAFRKAMNDKHFRNLDEMDSYDGTKCDGLISVFHRNYNSCEVCLQFDSEKAVACITLENANKRRMLLQYFIGAFSVHLRDYISQMTIELWETELDLSSPVGY